MIRWYENRGIRVSATARVGILVTLSWGDNIVAIILAIGVALVFPHFGAKLKPGGEIFLRLLKMMVVPLVVTSVMCGILGMGDVRRLGKPGISAVTYYLVREAVAMNKMVMGYIHSDKNLADILTKVLPGSEQYLDLICNIVSNMES